MIDRRYLGGPAPDASQLQAGRLGTFEKGRPAESSSFVLEGRELSILPAVVSSAMLVFLSSFGLEQIE
jgi:hypothetical protein